MKSITELTKKLDTYVNLVKQAKSEYGGNGPFELPANHKPALRVPKGGSMCANCKYVSEDLKHCANKYYQKWYGSSELPLPADELCSDWYEPKGEL